MACPITDNSQRKYPLKQPDGWQPKVPRWTLRLPDHVRELVIAYIGVQDRGSEVGIVEENYARIKSGEVKGEGSRVFGRAVDEVEAWVGRSAAVVVNRFDVLAGRDLPGTREWVCYWIERDQAEVCLERLDLKGVYERSRAGLSDEGDVGLWLEVMTPDLTRFETNYNGLDYKPGIAELEGTTLEPHDLTGYWGAARDRIRSSAYDNFEDHSEANGSAETKSRYQPATDGAALHLKGRNTHTIAHIRSGQFWENCDTEECAAYENKLEPHLFNGLADIFSRPDELGDYGLRFLRNLPPDNSTTQTTRKETCAAGFSRSLAHLESWAKDCPSHHKIYGGAINHKIKYGKEAKLRTWHEVAVLKPGEARWEYLNCVEGTGTIAFQRSEPVDV